MMVFPFNYSRYFEPDSNWKRSKFQIKHLKCTRSIINVDAGTVAKGSFTIINIFTSLQTVY